MATSQVGQERSHSPTMTSHLPSKKRRIHHTLHHTQRTPLHTEPAPQDPIFIQAQLLRSLTAALAIAGFDSVKPSALEMFRAQTEEYMQHFLSTVRSTMHASRRTRPIPRDFALALAQEPHARTTALETQLSLPLPEAVSAPAIAPPDPAPPPAPDFSALLAPLTTGRKPAYVPAHFPPLPSRHTFQETAVFPAREKDARRMRERATEEGVLAERALRKLAVAAKAGQQEKRRRGVSVVLSGPGEKVKGGKRGREDLFKDVWREIGGGEDGGVMEGALDGASDGVDLGMPEGVVVNHDLAYWRGGRMGTV